MNMDANAAMDPAIGQRLLQPLPRRPLHRHPRLGLPRQPDGGRL